VSAIERSEPGLGESFEPFWERLRETIAWCRSSLDVTSPALSLRSEGNRPRALEPNYFAAVSTVASLRRSECWQSCSQVPLRSLEEGRLLAYQPDMDLACGAAQAASQGFFDVNNAPPWDTWVAMVQESGVDAVPYLVSWIPPQFVSLAQQGIDANPECCIVWLEDAGAALAERVRVALLPRS
jgi:hypothetical protein